jgi:capsular polysaccharide biosynthesis protein
VVSKIRSLLFPLFRKILRILAKLLGYFDCDSKFFGPPKGYYWTFDDLIQSKVDNSEVILKDRITSVTIGKPFNFQRLPDDSERDEQIFEECGIRLNLLENGRFHLNPHAVISSNDKLVFSESCCYGMDPNKHWIFNQIKLSKCTELDGKAFMLGGRANYWHLLSEELPSLYRLKKNGFKINDFDHLIIHESKYNFQNEIYDLFEIPKIKFVELKSNQHVQAKQLFFFSPIYQPDIDALTWTRDYLLKFAKEEPQSKKRLFICRESSNSKRIVDNKEINELLIKYDFEILKPENYTVKEQIELFKNSSFVIGAHGAALANLMFCKPKTNVIEIRSRSHSGSFTAPHVYMWYKELNNLRYSVLTSEIKESKSLKGRSKMDSDFIVDFQELESLIQLHLNNE